MSTPPIPPPPVVQSVRRVEPYRPQEFVTPTGPFQRAINAIPAEARSVRIPSKLPKVLANRPVIFNAWIVAMVAVSWDEWHNLGIFPRPKRLWYTSVVYGLLVVVSFADAVVPVANALAIGYTIVLLSQLWSGSLTPAGKTNTTGGAGGSGRSPTPQPNAAPRAPTPGGVITNPFRPTPAPAPGG
jgi:hypothetical protein